MERGVRLISVEKSRLLRMSEDRQADIHATFEKHRAEPGVTIDEYVRHRRIELGKLLDGKRRIYLDKRYWIVIRDVALGRRTDQSSTGLLVQLRRLVSSGTAFCPVSEVLFIELLKQTDLYTRRETAKVIDELSLGVSLAPEEERVGTELAHLFHATKNPNSVYPLDWLVWLKVPYAVSMAHPTNTSLAPTEERALQKTFFDQMWDMTLVELVDNLGDAEPPSLINCALLAEKLNVGMRTHAQEIRSFKQAYATEIAGALSVYSERAIEIFTRMEERLTGVMTNNSEAKKRETAVLLHKMLTNAMRLGKLSQRLPTLHVIAMCHAAYRWDTKRRFEANDIFDFHHASAALGFCDIFLTENDLRTQLTAGHLMLDKELDCVVLSDTGKAVAHLSSL